MLGTQPKSTKVDEYSVSSEQVQKLLQILNKLLVSAQAKKIIVIAVMTSLKELVNCMTLHHERFCFLRLFSPQLRLRRADDPSIAMIATSIVK